jgi:hypothetical protein
VNEQIMASSSDVAVKFMTMVENKKYEGLNSLEAFFERRASDFATLEFAEAEDEKGVKKLGVVGEHELVWTEHHAAYTKLVEEALGIPQFCEENTVTEKELFQSMAILVKENSDVQMFVDSLVSMADYDGFLKIAYNVKKKTHCFEPHLTISPESCHGDGGHSHGHGHGHHGHGHGHEKNHDHDSHHKHHSEHDKEKGDDHKHKHEHGHGHGHAHGHGHGHGHGDGHGEEEKEKGEDDKHEHGHGHGHSHGHGHGEKEEDDKHDHKHK